VSQTAALFELTSAESESLANKAGLSLCERENSFVELLSRYRGKYCDLLAAAGVSERMLQYYISGKVPAKQALLAISISLGLSIAEIEDALKNYGYCLSRSLPNDAVTRWHLEHNRANSGVLAEINKALNDLELPLLMTKLIDRREGR
jgi:hypothetical protein